MVVLRSGEDKAKRAREKRKEERVEKGRTKRERQPERDETCLCLTSGRAG